MKQQKSIPDVGARIFERIGSNEETGRLPHRVSAFIIHVAGWKNLNSWQHMKLFEKKPGP